MQKPASLRQVLTAALPEFRNEPDRIALWIEDGAVRATGTASEGFSFEYPLSVYLKEVKTDIAIVALAITRWLRVNQPDLLVPPARSFQFESDILDNDAADLLFTLQLRENVKVTPNQDGSAAVDYLAEPDPLMDDGVPVGDADPAVLLDDVTVSEIVGDA